MQGTIDAKITREFLELAQAKNFTHFQSKLLTFSKEAQEDLIYDLLKPGTNTSLSIEESFNIMKIAIKNDILVRLVLEGENHNITELGKKLGTKELKELTIDLLNLATDPKSSKLEAKREAVLNLRVLKDLLINCDQDKLNVVIKQMEDNDKIKLFTNMSLVLINISREDIGTDEKPNIVESYIVDQKLLDLTNKFTMSYSTSIAQNKDFFSKVWQHIGIPQDSPAYIAEQKRIASMLTFGANKQDVKYNPITSLPNDKFLSKVVDAMNGKPIEVRFETPPTKKNKLLNAVYKWLQSVIKKAPPSHSKSSRRTTHLPKKKQHKAESISI